MNILIKLKFTVIFLLKSLTDRKYDRDPGAALKGMWGVNPPPSQFSNSRQNTESRSANCFCSRQNMNLIGKNFVKQITENE